jgi:polysaccharide biosynthesis protein PslG
MVGRTVLPALIALALACAGPAVAAARPPVFGVNVNRVVNDDFTPAHWNRPFADVRASGLTEARTDAFWMWAEPRPPRHGVHSYDWWRLDAVAGALAKHHLRWLAVLDYSAIWAATYRGDYHSPPRSNADYAAYARAFAARYGRGGSFWRRHPHLPRLPVTAYEVWNEPNNGTWFWKPRPDPARYADMYLRARRAIHAVDPRATVLVGGLVAHPAFVAKMYAARPDLHGNVDAIGWHAYAPRVNGLLRGLRELRATLELEGEPDLPVQVTELGWPTSGGDPTVLREPARSVAFANAATKLARSDCGISALVAYTWRTPRHDATGFGIRRPDGGPGPSSRAFTRVAQRFRRKTGAPLAICHPGGAGAAIATDVRLGTGATVTALI